MMIMAVIILSGVFLFGFTPGHFVTKTETDKINNSLTASASIKN